MLVSTKHLSLMEFIPWARGCPAQVKTPPKTGQGTPARLMIALALAHCLLQPGSKQGTNGRAFLGSENTSFPRKLRFDSQCNIGLHICTYSRVALFYVLISGRPTASSACGELRIAVVAS